MLAAFALSEPQAGSDVAAMTTSARRDGDDYVLDGTKTWISNGGIADFYCVFARTSSGVRRADGTTGAQGISAFVVEPGDPGFSVAGRIDVSAPHPLATLRFDGLRIPASRRIGAEGEGFKIAMRTLDVFRTSVAAAALGFAQRALDEDHECRDDDDERGDAEHERDRIRARVELLQRLADRAREPGGDPGEDQQRDQPEEESCCLVGSFRWQRRASGRGGRRRVRIDVPRPGREGRAVINPRASRRSLCRSPLYKIMYNPTYSYFQFLSKLTCNQNEKKYINIISTMMLIVLVKIHKNDLKKLKSSNKNPIQVCWRQDR